MFADSEPLYGGWFAYEKEFENVADQNSAIINLCYEELKRVSKMLTSRSS